MGVRPKGLGVVQSSGARGQPARQWSEPVARARARSIFRKREVWEAYGERESNQGAAGELTSNRLQTAMRI